VSALQDGDQRSARHVPDGGLLAPLGEATRPSQANLVSPPAIPPGTRPELCDNRNHYRRDAPVRHFPSCGAVVNAGVAVVICDEQKHAAARLHRSRFCTDCGARLIAA
jgi:hypothetical protein